jgi:sugar lactone lactonase YvrE
MKRSFELPSGPVRFRQIARNLLFSTIACAVFAGAAQSQAPPNGAQSNNGSSAQSTMPPWIRAANERAAAVRSVAKPAPPPAGSDASAGPVLDIGTSQSSVAADKLISPQGVAVDASGDLYVTDSALQHVFKVTPEGKRSIVGSGFMVPQAVAVDGAGNVYVADSQAGVIYKVTPDGVQVTVGSGFYMPMSVAVDAAGNVYAADPWNDFVAQITPDGTQTNLGSGYNTPVGVAVDAAGNVYVADTYSAAVFKIAPDGTQTTLGNGLVAPMYVAVDPAGLYLCRQLPTLPHTFACSTIGPAGLNFRVRDGNGWNPRGKITDKSEPSALAFSSLVDQRTHTKDAANLIALAGGLTRFSLMTSRR